MKALLVLALVVERNRYAVASGAQVFSDPTES